VFIKNLKLSTDLGPYSQPFIFCISYALNLAGKAYPFLSYTENEVFVNMGPGAVFTTLYFLCNLCMGEQTQLTRVPLPLANLSSHGVMYANLLGLFISKEEYEVLRICTLGL
jgi:hypothetical protein